MLNLTGYQETDRLYRGTRTLVARAIRTSDRQPVIIKTLANPHPNFNEFVQFRNQYAIAQNLEHPAIVRPLALERYGNGYALVMPDDGSISLWDDWQQEKRTLGDFLDIAIQLAQVLHYTIGQRVIHKDIKPANILIHPQTRQVKLIDFSISTLLPKERQQLLNPNVLEGTLAYISPEQTGRMNRGIDYRTDFYSLGVTFFQLLTGQLPFATHDPMELVHCHIAKTPPLVIRYTSSVIREPIPPMLSDIVRKLMAKNAEDRYQSALGLQHDLERCRQLWSTTGEIAPFPLGERDIGDRFVIPEKLYGREREVAQLLAAFARVAGTLAVGAKHWGDLCSATPQVYSPNASPAADVPANPKSELILVAGFSGIGKTAVVNEVHKPIVKQRGYFIKGKFDQFNRNIPFSAFVQAFRDLMGQLLGESDAALAQWKAKILQAVGDNGQVIIDVIPELAQILGKQPPVLELSGSAAQNRFNSIFGKFVRVFATPEHPLVMFLDDLQWADSASLNLLKLLLAQSQTGYLLVVGAYRDNEVFPAHPLMLTLSELERTEAVVSTIVLQPLAIGHIDTLVAETLSCDAELARPLTELVYRKTQGNPFFTTQFLQGLHEDRLIEFDRDVGYWKCDLARVREAALTDDVVQFVAGRLQKLPEATQQVLKLAACIGDRFDLETLAVVCEASPERVAIDLWGALQEGLILPIDEAYKFFQGSTGETAAQTASVGYRFLHDRIQQAAYGLIPQDRQQITHYRIGRLLLRQIPPEARADRIFELVGQLNYGTALATDRAERDELAELNLIACRKARSATAYPASREYAEMGLNLLGEMAWQRQYEMTLEFYNLAAELASLCGDFAAMERAIETVVDRVRSLLEKVEVYRIRILANVARNQPTEALTIARQLLRKLGVEFPETIAQDDIRDSIAEIETLIGDRQITDLDRLPVTEDGKILAILQIIRSIIPAAYISGSLLFPAIVTRSVKLSIQAGNTSISPLMYAAYGMMSCNVLQDVETGVKFGQLAVRVVSKLDAKEIAPEALQVAAGFILHRKSHVKETLPLLQETYTNALEVGNQDFAGHSAVVFCLHSVWSGQPLTALEPDLRAYSQGLAQLNQTTTANYCRLHWQAALNLLGTPEKPSVLSGEVLQETEILTQLTSAEDWYGSYIFYLYKLMLCYLFGELEAAREYGVEARKYARAGAGSFGEPAFYFYDSLTALATLDPCSGEAAAIWDRVEQNQRQLQQKWADYSPANHQHKVDLVAAEKCRVLGQKNEAIDLYDRAISGAKDNEYRQEEALANELAARFYLDWGKEKIAASYLQEAYYGYARWGAKAKTDRLERTDSQLLAPILKSPLRQSTGTAMTRIATETIASTSTGVSDALDWGTAIKASQALSEEMNLDKLLSTLMQVAIENAGATQGALILERSGELVVAARCSERQCSLETPIDPLQNLPLTIVHSVWRTQETLVLDNASTEIRFAADPYIVESQPKSVLCLPLQKQGKAIALLYLENRLTAEAFTNDRVEVLKILASQAAISLENARLYKELADYSHTLEDKVSERTRDLSDALEQLKTAQDELIQQEKIAALGQLVTGVAHEVNTPLGAIRSSATNIADFLKNNLQDLPSFFQNLSGDRQRDFFRLLESAQRKPDDLSSRERRKRKRTIATQLEAADVHDVDNIADTLVELGVFDDLESFFPLLRDPHCQPILKTADRLCSLVKSTQTISTATDRAAKIVFALKSYSRLISADEKVKIQIPDSLDAVLKLYQNQFNQGVTVVRNYSDGLPAIWGYLDELNQVWTNLIHNALQAMKNQGTLTVAIERRDRQICIDITDSGAGIPPDIQGKIFQPFFTTQPPGEGSGLGLDIVRKIVEKHQGAIDFHSRPGKTTFTVNLPILDR